MKKELTQVQIIGDAYYHRFIMNDGSIKDVETTREDYEQLGTPAHKNPTIKSGVWESSFATKKFDTISGKLEDGQYATDGVRFYSKPVGKDDIEGALSLDSLKIQVSKVELKAVMTKK